MILSFQIRGLLERCSTLELAEKWLGNPQAQLLIGMLADIEAFDNGSELLDLLGDHAQVTTDESITMSLGSSYHAVFVPVGVTLPRLEDGSTDWAKVRRLKLVEIRGASD
ncbi:MAG: hypothetical protein NVS2B5_21870 [Beijerinckiaceae bacterium]